MVTHKCTRCKVDQGPNGIRHKAYGGLFCDKCLTDLRGGIRVRIPGLGFFGRLWHTMADWVKAPFTHTYQESLTYKAAAVKVAYGAAIDKARSIPGNAQAGVPQKQ